MITKVYLRPVGCEEQHYHFTTLSIKKLKVTFLYHFRSVIIDPSLFVLSKTRF